MSISGRVEPLSHLYTGSPNEIERLEKGYSSAWLHHKGRNRHHLEYWIDYAPEHRPCGGCHCCSAPTTVPVACGCPVASRHSARGSGDEGANQKNVPLEQVPLAPQYPFERPTGGLGQEMIDLALELGFANAAVMDTKDLIFMPSFRPLT